MPLRDHFHAPLDRSHSWEGFHGGWPAVIVQQLRRQLPAGYTAEPRVNSGSQIESDAVTLEKAATTLPDFDEYEVRIYDTTEGRRLVAAIEIVSPANKERVEKRSLFAAKCAALLEKGVAVSIIDVVTGRHFNLYAQVLALIGHEDPTLGDPPAHTYAASCRWVKKKRALLQLWSHVLTIGGALPTLPLWLSEDLAVPLDLERSYEQTCDDLWIA